MKRLYLILTGLLVCIAAQAWTVKFTNPDNWASVYVWAWDENDNNKNYTGGVWPGQMMTKSGDVWTFTATGTPTHVIFSGGNGQPQTGNLAFTDGATYDKFGPVGVETNDFKVYFKNTNNWEKVYLYGWEGINTPGWPGVEVTDKTTDGLYVYTFKTANAEAAGNIIWNNGSGGAVGVDQTDDLTWKTDAVYDINGEMADAPTVEVPFILYVLGNIDGNDWAPNLGVEMAREDNKFVAEGVNLSYGTSEDAYFSFATVLGATAEATEWDAAVNSGNRYGATTADVQLAQNVATPMELYAAGVNASSAAAWKVPVGIYTITADFSNMTVTVVRTGDVPVVDPVDPDPVDPDPVDPDPVDPTVTLPSALYVLGNLDGNNWAPDLGKAMTVKGNTFTAEGVNLSYGDSEDAYFSLATVIAASGETDWDATVNGGDRYGATEADVALADNTPTTMVLYAAGVDASSCPAWKVPVGIYTITADFATMKVTAVRTGDVPVVDPVDPVDPDPVDPDPVDPDPATEELVVAGSMNSWAENAPEYKLEYADGKYTISLGNVEANTEFKIKTAEAGWTKSWGAEGDPAATEAAPVEVMVGTPMNAWEGSGCNFLIVPAMNDVVITFVPGTDAQTPGQLTVTGKSSGVNSIELDAAEGAVYFNLQGVRVNNPENGVYIRVANGKSQKVMK